MKLSCQHITSLKPYNKTQIYNQTKPLNSYKITSTSLHKTGKSCGFHLGFTKKFWPIKK